MATYSVAEAKHATLSGATGDVVTLSNGQGLVEVFNRSTGTYLWCRVRKGPQDAIAAGDDNSLVIPPGMLLTVDVSGGGTTTVAVAGSSNPYSVQGLSE